MLDQDVYVPVNYISPEVYALLAAAEASAARHADSLGAGGMELNMGDHGSTLHMQGALDGDCDAERVLPSTAPPKRFYRTFWRSTSLRLLNRIRHTDSASSTQRVA